MEKSKSISFFFSLIPGAGQMYLGLMQKGLLIMLLCAGIVFTADFVGLHGLTILLPVIWFFSFFDTLHLRGLSYEQRLSHETAFNKSVQGFLQQDWKAFFVKYRLFFAIAIILLGIDLVFSNLIYPYLNYFGSGNHWLYTLTYHIPKAVVGIAMLIGGIYFVTQSPSHKHDSKDHH